MINNTRLGIKIIALINFIFGIFLLGWFFKASGYFTNVLSAILSSCPCSILAKIALLVVVLLIILFIKTGVQILKLDPRGRNDQININSMGIFILLFPLIWGHNKGEISCTSIICGLSIAYLAWSIVYLNLSKIKESFKEARI